MNGMIGAAIGVALGLLIFFGEGPRRIVVMPQPQPRPPPLPPPPATSLPPGAARPWTRATRAKAVHFEAGRQYAGVLDAGFKGQFASTDDVQNGLVELVRFVPITVWKDVQLVSPQLPLSREEKGGRFWLLGVCATSTSNVWPDELTEVWSRE